MKKVNLFFLMISLLSLSFMGQAQTVDITFRVNMANETVDPAGLYIAGGGNFGNPGDNPFTDMGGGIWEITVTQPQGFSSFYTLTNGACPDYSCKENLAGKPCGDPANFNDRFLPAVSADTTLLHCFGECTEDLSCPVPPTTVDVTFQVDMSETPPAGPIYVTGGNLDGWCGSCLEMTDPDMDMIYTYTATVDDGSTIEYKFNNGGWSGTENLDPTEDAACTLTTGPYTNRIVTVSGTTTLPAVCFNSCEECMGTPPPSEPTEAAPAPECATGDVISMFSGAFTDVPVDTWLTGWSAATDGGIVSVAGDDTRLYTDVDFLGIETVNNPIDASMMTHFNIDVWTPNMTVFRVKLVDFDPGGTTEGEIAFTPTQLGWNTFSIPMADFADNTMTTDPNNTLNNTSTISQLILSGMPVGGGTLYIDNVYFSGECEFVPMEAAPTPECATGDVISMFSDAFTDVPVDTWLTGWSGATGGDIVSVDGNDARLYENVDFLGIETVANPIDASMMTHFNIDVWTPNMTTFRVKLVDFDPGGTTEGEIAFTPTQLGWNTFSIPMADFADNTMTTDPNNTLNNTSTISQLILSGLPVGGGTLYIDNVYFSGECTPSCDAPASISAAATSTSNVLFTWDAVAGADLYQVKYRKRGTTTWEQFATALTQRNQSGLDMNHHYQYKVRARCGAGVWSDYTPGTLFEEVYTTVGCDVPTGVATVYLDNTSFKVRWDAAGEVKGKIRYREVGTMTWMTKNSQPGNNYIYVTGLTADANYEYRVRLNCSGDDWSLYNALYFHDLGNPEPRNAEELAGVALYPNPASNVLNITYNNEFGSEANVEVFDMLGRAVISEISNDSQVALNVSQLATGSYVVSIMVDGKQSIQKFVKR